MNSPVLTHKKTLKFINADYPAPEVALNSTIASHLFISAKEDLMLQFLMNLKAKWTDRCVKGVNKLALKKVCDKR